VTQLHLTGDWSAVQVKEGLELAMGGCQQLRAVMRQTLLEAALGAAQEQTVNGAADADMQQ
jgi:exosome complex component MTR3